MAQQIVSRLITRWIKKGRCRRFLLCHHGSILRSNAAISSLLLRILVPIIDVSIHTHTVGHNVLETILFIRFASLPPHFFSSPTTNPNRNKKGIPFAVFLFNFFFLFFLRSPPPMHDPIENRVFASNFYSLYMCQQGHTHTAADNKRWHLLHRCCCWMPSNSLLYIIAL